MDEVQQHWLYALSAPMVSINPGAGYLEPAFYAGPSPIDLDGSWGINDRDQLFGMLSLADNGHARHLNEAYHQWARCLPSEWSRLRQDLGQREFALYEFASRTFGVCGVGGIRAWDLGRMGFLLRCGLRNQWIDLSESLWLHSRLALRARHHYDNWDTYLNGFLAGYTFWKCERLPAEQLHRALALQTACESTQLVVRTLAKAAASLLEPLPWDLPLDPLPRPDSLGVFEWQ
ncbi:DUF1266 domain-containing protein [Pseudomonas sp. F8002]|uniref:DUF1266 domain-containing protein n=1 Tax=Pseudomonas sp. F8002 TaxID=2738822 RepID=UPI0015A3DF48|nr:DUF1266 domain-containing protein [Pseudomonas sp. F8002]NWB56421.1 DUF1266 domain-containing protein [Pseudomonas sp. F8002]